MLRESHTSSGAANVALNLASLGAGVSIIGTHGDDPAGEKLLPILQSAGVATDHC